ncbi:MAG: DUF4259 domain-containing protein [Myxococcota bacterium]
MGSWGHKAFENDRTLDWWAEVAKLEAALKSAGSATK